jgi:hypothetical protein
MNFQSLDARHSASISAYKSVEFEGPVLWDKAVVRQLQGFPYTHIMRPVRATAVGELSVPETLRVFVGLLAGKDVHANFICGPVIDNHDSSVRLSLLWLDRKLRRRD